MQTITPFALLDKLAGRWLDWRAHQLAKNVQPETFDFGIKTLTAKEAEIEITAIAPGIAFLADEAVSLLQKTGAPNSVQFDMFPRVDHATRPVRVTVAWADGEMPNAKAARLEKERDALAADLSALYRMIVSRKPGNVTTEDGLLASLAVGSLWAYADKSAGLDAENVRLRTALEKYADPDNWDESEEEVKDLWTLTHNGYTLAEVALKPDGQVNSPAGEPSSRESADEPSSLKTVEDLEELDRFIDAMQSVSARKP